MFFCAALVLLFMNAFILQSVSQRKFWGGNATPGVLEAFYDDF